jgi:hypothetical protein
MTGDRRRDRLAHGHPTDVGDDAVGEAREFELTLGGETDQRNLGAGEGT